MVIFMELIVVYYVESVGIIYSVIMYMEIVWVDVLVGLMVLSVI